jgi:hydrogenase maturation protein HypF
MTERAAIEVTGLVQGVGFRPFVYSLANELQLRGFVRNHGAHLFVDVEGDGARVRAFIERISRDRPRQAVIERVQSRPLPPAQHQIFFIADSEAGLDRHVNVPPDIATCDACVAELFDRRNRRYCHPFIACTTCGPRYSILLRMPFDRGDTTLARFPMCTACSAEYRDPRNRRFHAQAICCHDCGPTLAAETNGRVLERRDDALELAAQVLKIGGIVCVKGIGGFHLTCDATNDKAVRELRRRKAREAKPFAVMLPWSQARTLAERHTAAATALYSTERPIVLLRRDALTLEWTLSQQVAPGCPEIGVFLPYSPVHHLLLQSLDRPLVMTSGNRRDEPMVCENQEALERLGIIADLFLTHDRPIQRRCDDGVVRVGMSGYAPLRRGRGSMPTALILAEQSPATILGVGGDLKNTFCFVDGARAYVSPHIGNVETLEGSQALSESIAHLGSLLNLETAIVAHDLHPDFLSRRVARAFPDVPRVAVQHHHAHVLSCVAEHRWTGPVIGVAFDGAGLGTDGAVWGGEFLVVEAAEAKRVAHLEYVPLPGGDAAAREPWRMAVAHLTKCWRSPEPVLEALRSRVGDQKVAFVQQMIACGTCSPSTSSMGRLFDAVAAMVGVRDTSAFEGQAAMELEAIVTDPGSRHYAFEIDTSREPWLIQASPVIAAIVDDLDNKRPAGEIAARFHEAVGRLIADVTSRMAQVTGFRTVVLTGGVFQNAHLSAQATLVLTKAELNVLRHRHVPCNDGGLSLGQCLFALRALRKGEIEGGQLPCA